MSVDEYIKYHRNWDKGENQDDIIGKLFKKEIKFEEGDRFTDANAVIDTKKEDYKMIPRLCWYYDGCLIRWNEKREID
jgi:hypothetical protein